MIKEITWRMTEWATENWNSKLVKPMEEVEELDDDESEEVEESSGDEPEDGSNGQKQEALTRMMDHMHELELKGNSKQKENLSKPVPPGKD